MITSLRIGQGGERLTRIIGKGIFRGNLPSKPTCKMWFCRSRVELVSVYRGVMCEDHAM